MIDGKADGDEEDVDKNDDIELVVVVAVDVVDDDDDDDDDDGGGGGGCSRDDERAWQSRSRGREEHTPFFLFHSSPLPVRNGNSDRRDWPG